MTFQSLHTTLAEVVPDLHRLVVASSYEVRLVCTRVEFDVVHALVMRFHRKVRGGRTKGPHLYSTIQARGCEGIGVFGIDRNVHDVVCMSLVRLQIRRTT